MFTWKQKCLSERLCLKQCDSINLTQLSVCHKQIPASNKDPDICLKHWASILAHLCLASLNRFRWLGHGFVLLSIKDVSESRGNMNGLKLLWS